MNDITQHAIRTYSRVGVETGVATASPHRLILMLLEGGVKAVAEATLHMERGVIPAKGQAISQALAILESLRSSLDHQAGGEIATNLDALYDYMCRQLLTANLHNKPGPLAEVGRLFSDLRDAWAAIGAHQSAAAGASPDYACQTVISFGKA